MNTKIVKYCFRKKQHNIERILGICMDTLEQNKP